MTTQFESYRQTASQEQYRNPGRAKNGIVGSMGIQARVAPTPCTGLWNRQLTRSRSQQPRRSPCIPRARVEYASCMTTELRATPSSEHARLNGVRVVVKNSLAVANHVACPKAISLPISISLESLAWRSVRNRRPSPSHVSGDVGTRQLVSQPPFSHRHDRGKSDACGCL